MALAQRGGGRTGRHLIARGGKRANVFKNSRENSDCIISYVLACNKKTKHYSCSAYLSSVSWAITLSYTLNRLSSFQRRKGGKFDHRPSGQRSCYATAEWRATLSILRARSMTKRPAKHNINAISKTDGAVRLCSL